MNKNLSSSVTVRPKPKSGDDLVQLSGRWNIGVNVRIENPAVITKGPLRTVLFDRRTVESPEKRCILFKSH